MAELADEPLGARLPEERGYLRRHAERAGCVPDMRGTTTDYSFARSLVAAGVGVSLIPSIALTPEVPGLRAVPIDPPTPTRSIGVAVPRHCDHPPVATLVQALATSSRQ
ncbi:LysR substrate-binding domain-containing protein [Streptomyces sp. NPDC101169]|uniref:LysR substrate-binding domain-containing protein n=1 Tax=Streptomyces sp. NPDC101169 TaxID=3366121 RepID=UPI0037F4BBBA